MCGLRSKLIDPEFTNVISEYDIVTLLETKTDNNDVITVPGFVCYLNNRTTTSRVRSGGVGVLIKDELSPFVTVCDIKTDLLLWLKVQQSITCDSDDIYIGVIYNPPENSKYAHKDNFDILGNELIDKQSIANKVFLIGDFNARSGAHDDYCIIDDVNRFENSDDDILVYMSEPLKFKHPIKKMQPG